ncbi:MAG: hypothetical protein ACRCX2_09240 [Paraclostridium sp.]
MFLERYKKFKELLNEDNSFYEYHSVDDNPLFGIKELLSEQPKRTFNIDFLRTAYKESDSSLLKLKFIKGFLKDYKEQLIDQAIILDNEYKKINSSVSLKGSSFLEMMEQNYGFNHVFDEEVQYVKNIKVINDDYIKSDETSKTLEHYITFPNEQSINFNFKKKTKVKEIYVEFHSSFTISIFGVKETGETEMLFANVSSDGNLFINTKDEEFVRIFITGNGNLKNYYKYSSLYSSGDTGLNSNGFIFRTVTDVLKVRDIFFLSDSPSSLFLYKEHEYKEFLKTVVKDEDKAIEKYINDLFRIEKNEKIELNNKENVLYLVEFLNKETNRSKRIKIYGKES